MQLEPSELNLVRSGLEETMKEGFENILEVKKNHWEIQGLTTAAYTLAIEKIKKYYEGFMI